MDDFEEKLNSILSSPEAMGQIMSLANALSGGNVSEDTPTEPEPVTDSNEPVNPFELLQGIDPAMLQRMMGLFRTYGSGNSEKAALLQALRPFVREERREKLDKAIQYTRFSRLILAALEQLRGDGYV